MKEVAQFIATFDAMRTTKDGGGKITFEFGQDSIEQIHEIVKWNKAETCFVVAVAPYIENKKKKGSWG